MSKGTKKGRTERRKHPRGSRKKASVPQPDSSVESCRSCERKLTKDDRALFVEEEVGRIFCSEDCITEYFRPEIEKLEARYFKLRPKSDLSPEEREQFSHLRWITLQEPDEVWRAKTLDGDYRYTLVSEFKPGDESVYCICICLFLRGEPSFLFLSFPTNSASLVNHFREGERVEWVKENEDSPEPATPTDGLAEDWTESETLQAEIHATREKDDIPPEEFGFYEKFTEKTLQEPDELWIVESEDDGEPDLYQFIRSFSEEAEPGSEGLWYVVVAQDAEDGESLEVVEQFPTRRSGMLARFRRGRQEIKPGDPKSSSRMVH